MAPQRPPGRPSDPETLDSNELQDINETAAPQLSPLRAALPFAGPSLPQPTYPQPYPAPMPPPRSTGEETAPPERSPLAGAMPFRHAKEQAATQAIPMMTPDVLRRLGISDPEAPTGAPKPLGGKGGADRAKAEQAKTVAFAIPPVPEGGGPVAKKSTGHFGLSIEQYAALCAEVAVFQHAADAIFAKYGLASPRDRMTADMGWQERLRADPALMQRWQTLYLHYHEYYLGTARR